MTPANTPPPPESTEPVASVLRIHLLGSPIWVRGAAAPVTLAAKDAALLAKLALDGPQARALVCALMWPESPAKQAAASLRQRASRLNREAGAEIISNGDPVRLHPAVLVDADEPSRLSTPELMKTGQFLGGIDLGQHEELERWITQARQRVTEACARVLAERADGYERERLYDQAVPLAQRVTELLPLAEHGWRCLMRLHYLRNDRAAAQEAFWRLHTLLRDELGIRPSAETLALMAAVEAADVPMGRPARTVPVSLLRPPVMVGRHAQWRAMGEAWDRAQPFLLVGEAGLGKTRLLEEFTQGQTSLVRASGQPGDTQSPYALLGRVLAWVEKDYRPPLVPWQQAELARLRPEFGTAATAPASAPVLWHAVEEFLAAAVAKGLYALVLDDLHNADAASLEALRWLQACTSLSALRMALATRPLGDPDGPLMAWLADSHRPVRIDVGPLSLQDLRALLATLALPSLLDGKLSAQLHRHAGGHPYFSLAVLQDALLQGMDLDAGQLPQPGGVQALLDARLRHLDNAAQDLLRVAAVAGPDLRADLVARVLNRAVLDLSAAWGQLEAADILRGESFSHDLVHEAALRAVPLGVRQALHRDIAALLSADPNAPPARTAAHWQQGGRWHEAARHWFAAGEAALAAGRLAEQAELLARAAQCYAEAGDREGQFRALHLRVEAVRLLQGGQAAIQAMAEVQPLAATGPQRLLCHLARAAASIDCELVSAAAAHAEDAVRESQFIPALQAQALSLHAEALAQCRRYEDALAAANAALAAAEAQDDGTQKHLALEALSYVQYHQGYMALAVKTQRQAVALAESLGRRADAATGDGHIAALLASVGDVAGTYEHAVRTRDRHREIGMSSNSTVGLVNHIMLGGAAAALGRFDEALAALQEAMAQAGSQAAMAAQAKARLGLAQVWLTLGRPEAARELARSVPDGAETGKQMLKQYLLARAARAEGASAQRPLQILGELGKRLPEQPLVQGPWFEWSFQGDPLAVVTHLQAVRTEALALGLDGTAASLQWRELERWLEIPGAQALLCATQHAEQLAPRVDGGLSAKCYPPQVWETLAKAFDRSGRRADTERCREAALRWLDRALTRVPSEYQDSFVQRNPHNRAWLIEGAYKGR